MRGVPARAVGLITRVRGSSLLMTTSKLPWVARRGHRYCELGSMIREARDLAPIFAGRAVVIAADAAGEALDLHDCSFRASRIPKVAGQFPARGRLPLGIADGPFSFLSQSPAH